MNYLTTTEAAESLGITRRGVLKAIERDQLPAEKWGRDWQISRYDVDRYGGIRKAWEILGITKRVWGKLLAALWVCPKCGENAYIPCGIAKYAYWKACPSCGWAEKGRDARRG